MSNSESAGFPNSEIESLLEKGVEAVSDEAVVNEEYGTVETIFRLKKSKLDKFEHWLEGHGYDEGARVGVRSYKTQIDSSGIEEALELDYVEAVRLRRLVDIDS